MKNFESNNHLLRYLKRRISEISEQLVETAKEINEVEDWFRISGENFIATAETIKKLVEQIPTELE